ncbi:MAG: efflux RND transporter periplasmic adaptor subunit [Deltaproteobacteria bacterium]|nr:efflux RND transporter periplasmic adaptor subunit [Deltaproteobacteria bacterium]
MNDEENRPKPEPETPDAEPNRTLQGAAGGTGPAESSTPRAEARGSDPESTSDSPPDPSPADQPALSPARPELVEGSKGPPARPEPVEGPAADPASDALLPHATAEDDPRLQAMAARGGGGVWRVVAVVQFLLIFLLGGGVAMMAVLKVGPFAPVVAGAQTGETWTCPMHPQVRQDHPGDCPICGMTLVKEKPAEPQGGEHAEHAVPGTAPVTVPTSVLQHGSVRVARAARATMGDELLTIGRVEADETRVAHVHSQVMGWVTVVNVNQTGQFVARGDVLLEIFSRDILQTQQELLAVGGRRGGAAGAIGDPIRTLADAARQRLLVYGVPPDVIEDIERTGKPRATIPIRSPSSGFVLMKNVLDGMFVEPGMEMFVIASLSNVWVWADVYEQDLRKVHLDDRAEVRTLALGDRLFDGRVTFFSPEVDMMTRTLRVRIEIQNPDLALRPGMWASVRIVGGENEVLAVPYDAVVDTGTSTYVFVQSGTDMFTARHVVAGRSSGDLTEIREGLAVGDVVVASGTFIVDSESRIRGGDTGGGAHAGHGEQAANGEAPATEPRPSGGGNPPRSDDRGSGAQPTPPTPPAGGHAGHGGT